MTLQAIDLKSLHKCSWCSIWYDDAGEIAANLNIEPAAISHGICFVLPPTGTQKALRERAIHRENRTRDSGGRLKSYFREFLKDVVPRFLKLMAAFAIGYFAVRGAIALFKGLI